MLRLAAIALAIGIWAGDALGVGPWLAAGWAAAWAAVTALAWRREQFVGLAALGLACAIGVAGQAARPRAPVELTDGGRWTIEAEVSSAPERAFGLERVMVALLSVERAGQVRAATGRVLVTINGAAQERLLPGDRVRFVATLRPPRGLYNPGGMDGERRAAALGVVAQAGVHDPAALSRLAGRPEPTFGPMRRLAARRARMLDAVDARLDGAGRALVRSLVLGDRGEIDRPLDDAFRVAGVSHVLSVSGLHLAIAALLFYGGLRRLLLWLPGVGRGWPVRRYAAAAALPATVAYTLVTGAQVATVRACVVACLWLVAVALGRRSTAADALAGAALAILCVAPLELFDPSFQLSFAAALGTTLLAPRWSPGGHGGPLAARAARWTGRLVAASVAAILATLPIGLWHFAQLAPMGVLSNLVVVPLAELGVVPVGLFGSVLATSGIPPGDLLIRLAGFQAELLAQFVVWFASWAPSWRMAAPGFVEIVSWYAGLLAVALAVRRARTWLLACLVVLVAAAAVRAGTRRFSDTLTATFLDVGQGDACVLELPRGRVIVIDGGGSFDAGYDPGEQVLAPFLWRRGIRRIDLLVLSHPHPDHANGLGYLAEQFEIGEVWHNGQETRQPGTVRLLAAAQRRNIPVSRPRPLVLAGVTLVPLGPFDENGGLEPDPTFGENDNSLVLRVEHRGRRLLFPGDAEADAEAALVARGGLRADVLKVPHHGSRTSSSEAFVAAVQPTAAVISLGARNRWGFPNPGVLARYQAVGAQVLRTDRDGAVTVTVDGRGRLDWTTVRR